MKRAHARHNEETCDFLLKSGGFNDWVVTTAFYSALHYVHYEIFPLELGGKSYEGFNYYYNSKCTSINERPSKHQVTIDLVNRKLYNCYRYYRWLHDECMNARYNNYKVSDNTAVKAKKYLELIKPHLSKLTDC